MTLLQSVVLGALLGLTEFLPVSSSGHIVLAKALMHLNTGNDFSFEVLAHIGPLISVVIIFREQIRETFGAVLAALKEPGNFAARYRESAQLRLALFVLVGCVPAAIIGGLFSDPIEKMFEDPKLVSDMLLVTGAVLFFSRLAKTSRRSRVSMGTSIGIGCAQAVAVIPGISRPGLTISTGLLLGVNQDRAAEFSFLMSVPVIFGATLLKGRHLLQQPPSMEQLAVVTAGTAVAFITGYVALRLVLAVLKKGKFSLFSYYCFIVGILGILFVE